MRRGCPTSSTRYVSRCHSYRGLGSGTTDGRRYLGTRRPLRGTCRWPGVGQALRCSSLCRGSCLRGVGRGGHFSRSGVGLGIRQGSMMGDSGSD